MKYDILKFNDDVTTLKINANKIDGLKTAKIQKTAARIFKGGKIFSAAAVGDLKDEALLEKANSSSNFGLSFGFDLPANMSSESYFANSEIKNNGIEVFKDFFIRLQKEHPNLNWSGTFRTINQNRSFASDYGVNHSGGGDLTEGFLLYKRWGSTDFCDGCLILYGAHLDFKKSVQDELPLLNAIDAKATVKTGKMPVLLLDSSTLADRLKDDLMPTSFHTNSSYLSGKLNEQIFHPKVTFKDISFHPKNGQFLKFDGEGVLHKNPAVFENGVFKGPLYDLRQAKNYGTESTGNGLRQYDTGVDFNFHQLTLSAGTEHHWEMIQSLPECLVVSQSHGGSTTDQWEYSYPIQTAYLFKNGVNTGRIPSASLKASFKDMLGKDLLGIARETFTGNTPILTQMEVIAH